MTVGSPLALGSPWTLLILIPGFLALAVRIVDEERMLAEQLPGYPAYTQKVRYRLVPHVW
jgi:protein-S-isoprenylcysteine O-methyltransferase Ste14